MQSILTWCGAGRVWDPPQGPNAAHFRRVGAHNGVSENRFPPPARLPPLLPAFSTSHKGSALFSVPVGGCGGLPNPG